MVAAKELEFYPCGSENRTFRANDWENEGSMRQLEVVVDVTKILEELRKEREQIEEAILTLERLVENRGRRRGRPPSWLSEARRRGKVPSAPSVPNGKASADAH